MDNIYKMVVEFRNKYPGGVYWFRLKKHCEVIATHLNPNEKVKYAFVGQKNNSIFDIFSTGVIVITNKRLLIGRKRVVWGYFLDSVTPDLFNDMKIYQGLIWGKVTIDTLKERIFLTNIAKDALPEIETKVSSFMMEEKKKYGKPNGGKKDTAVA